jgi:hypothetical protein
MTETEIKHKIILACRDFAVLRSNPTGVARHVDEKTGIARRVSYGVGGRGGTDLDGFFLVDLWGIYYEVKTPQTYRLKNNGLRRDQITVRDQLLYHGACWAVVCSPEMARAKLLAWRDDRRKRLFNLNANGVRIIPGDEFAEMP